MSTDWTASVRPVNSTASVISRVTGLLTGTATGSGGPTWGWPREQPDASAARATTGQTRHETGGSLMGWTRLISVRRVSEGRLIKEGTTHAPRQADDPRSIVERTWRESSGGVLATEYCGSKPASDYHRSVPADRQAHHGLR